MASRKTIYFGVCDLKPEAKRKKRQSSQAAPIRGNALIVHAACDSRSPTPKSVLRVSKMLLLAMPKSIATAGPGDDAATIEIA